MPRNWTRRPSICRNIRKNRKRLGRGKGRSLKSTHLAKSEILIIRIFTLKGHWTAEAKTRATGERPYRKIEQEKIK